MSIHGERYRAAGSRLFVRGKQRPSNRPSSARRFRHLHPPIGNVSNWKLDSSGMSKIQGAKKPLERLENSIAFSNSVSFVTGDGGRDSTTVPSKMETGGDLVGNIKVIRAKQTLPVITQSRESHRVEHDGTFFLSLSLSLSRFSFSRRGSIRLEILFRPNGVCPKNWPDIPRPALRFQ